MVHIAPFSLIEPDDAEPVFFIKAAGAVVIRRAVQENVPQPVVPDLLKAHPECS